MKYAIFVKGYNNSTEKVLVVNTVKEAMDVEYQLLTHDTQKQFTFTSMVIEDLDEVLEYLRSEQE